MRRAPWVLAGTGAGLAALLGYHTASLTPTGAAAPVAGGSSPGSGSAVGGSSGPGATGAGAGTATSAAGGASVGSPTSTSPPTTSSVRQANGQEVPYRYGDLEVRVVAKGGRITDVKTVMDESFDPRSAQINQEAVPLLRQQALAAQSANIDGVSGATYTSLAYQESLQAALDSLHLG